MFSQASNAGSERLFSIESSFVTKNRTKLKAKKVCDLILCRSFKFSEIDRKEKLKGVIDANKVSKIDFVPFEEVYEVFNKKKRLVQKEMKRFKSLMMTC